jgi:formamidopyrimidine-DNA glycosylase
MPELPEAETIVRGLRPYLTGRTIVDVAVLRPDILRVPASDFADCVRHRTFLTVTRRGKNVVSPLSGDRMLAVNLGMTGRLLHFPELPGAERAPGHPAVRFSLNNGSLLVFDDVRRFGTVECVPSDEWSERSGRMGPEPLDRRFTAKRLQEALTTSRSPVRNWLLDQRRIAGVGNIYANEALYQAGIHPRRPAREVEPDEAVKLHRALRKVLRNAIRAGGTTLRDYRTADGQRGRYGTALWVYGRDGSTCPRCKSTVERTVFGNRSAFFCAGCQPDAEHPR